MRVVVSPQGEIIGVMFVMDMAAPPVQPRAYGCVRPDWRRQGIGTWLVQWAEERARQAISRVPDGARVSMQIQSSSSHASTTNLLESLGFSAAHHSWMMMASLDPAPPAGLFPRSASRPSASLPCTLRLARTTKLPRNGTIAPSPPLTSH